MIIEFRIHSRKITKISVKLIGVKHWINTYFHDFLPLCHWNSWPTIDGTPMSNLTLIKRFKTLYKTQRKYTNWTLENRKSNCKKTVLTKKSFLFRWSLYFSRSGTPNPTASCKKLNYWESKTTSDFGAKISKQRYQN